MSALLIKRKLDKCGERERGRERERSEMELYDTE